MSIRGILIGIIILFCLRLAFCGGSDSKVEGLQEVVFDKIGGTVRAVFIFEDGWACMDTNVAWWEDPELHREKYPGTWRNWRREDGKLQLRWGDKWEDVTWQNERAVSYPKDHRFAGSFYRAGGAGSVRTSKTYTFYMDGTFTTKSTVAVSHTNHLSGASTGMYFPDDNRGRYHLDEYQLHLDFDSGKKVQKTIVVSNIEPMDSPGGMYLDGDYFRG